MKRHTDRIEVRTPRGLLTTFQFRDMESPSRFADNSPATLRKRAIERAAKCRNGWLAKAPWIVGQRVYTVEV